MRGFSMTLVAMGLLGLGTGQAANPPTLDPIPIKYRLDPRKLRGNTRCSYGAADCSVCVHDVERAFWAIDTGTRDSHKFPFSAVELDSVGPRDHTQGICRVPGVGQDNYLIITKKGEKGQVLVVEYPGIRSDGGAWKHADRTSDWGEIRTVYEHPEFDHPSGVQPAGKIVAVALECSDAPTCQGKAAVEFYDASKLPDLKLLSRLDLDGSQGEPEQGRGLGQRLPDAAFASMAKLADGRHLVLIAGRDSQYGWLYVSSGRRIGPSTRWTYLQTWRGDTVQQVGWWPDDSKAYQSGNFITECDTGRLYFVGMRKYRFGRQDRMELYRVGTQGDGELQLYRLGASKDVSTRAGGCDLRAAGFMHPTSDRRELVLYCLQKGNLFIDPKLNVEEFRDK